MKSNNHSLKIVICDDHPIVLSGLTSIFNGREDLHIAEITENGNDLLKAVQKHEPNLILIDAHLKNESGFDLIPQIKTFFKGESQPLIYIITSYMDDFTVSKAFKAGATGCISKSSSAEDIIQAIKNPQSHFTQFSEIATESNHKQQGITQLTQREREIIKLLSQGKSTKIIAEELFISIYTIETHKKNIFRKLNFNSVTELMAWVYSNKNLQQDGI